MDYDGTLMPFSDDPARVAPDARLRALLQQLGAAARTDVAVVSGRDRATLESWLGDLPVDLVAEHGIWSVSYTHLDVYKRQEHTGTERPAAPRTCGRRPISASGTRSRRRS